MKLLCRTSACFALTLSGLCCSAQQTAIRFPAFEESPTYLASDEGTNGIPSTSPTVVSKSSGSATAVMMMTGSVHAPAVVAHRSIGLSVFVVNMIQISAAGLDIAMTHRCIAGRTCKEGNPMMPSSLGGQVGVDVALISYSAFVSCRMKKRGSRMWWLSPMVGTAAHIVGAASSIRY